jgi:hypothetical protein
MALLDLQSMEEPEEETRGPANNSKGSKGCCTGSCVSLLICG